MQRSDGDAGPIAVSVFPYSRLTSAFFDLRSSPDMAPSRQDLLDLIEETYGTRHPDFGSIREQYERITDHVHDEDIESDARLLLAGVQATRNAYQDWKEMEEYEKQQALNALERIRNLTRSTLKKYDVAVD